MTAEEDGCSKHPPWLVDNHVPPKERHTLLFMSQKPPDDEIYIDSNGCLTELVTMDGLEVIVHYDNTPESDITSVDGRRCTTPLRTVIDLAPDLDSEELAEIIRDCLARKLFTVKEAMARIAEPDMLTRPGAQLLRQALGDPSSMT